MTINAHREHITQSSIVTREWYSFEISKNTVEVTYCVHNLHVHLLVILSILLYKE